MRTKTILIAAAALVCAYASTSHALSEITGLERASAPALASYHSPTKRVDSQLEVLLENGSLESLQDTALASLSYEPLNSRAIRLLAIAAQQRGDSAEALKLATLTEDLSRRDGTAQLILVGEIAAQPDASIAQILTHIDRALLVHPQLRDRVRPAMVQVLADEEARAAMAPYVRKASPWLPEVLFYVVSETNGAENVANLLLESKGNSPVMIPEIVDEHLYSTLYQNNQFEKLKELFLAANPDRSELLSDPSLGLASLQRELGPLVWQFGNTANIGAELLGAGREAALSVYALPGEQGIAVRRMMVLKPGSYEIQPVVEPATNEPLSGLEFLVECSDGARLAQAEANVSSQFVVPGGCVSLRVQIQIDGGDSQFGREYIVRSIEIDET